MTMSNARRYGPWDTPINQHEKERLEMRREGLRAEFRQHVTRQMWAAYDCGMELTDEQMGGWVHRMRLCGFAWREIGEDLYVTEYRARKVHRAYLREQAAVRGMRKGAFAREGLAA